jgi:hypothetical protein
MNFTESVLQEVNNAIEIPSDLQEFIILLLLRLEKDGFRVPNPDLYAYYLIHHLKNLNLPPSGFSVPLGLLVNREVPEKLRALNFHPNSSFTNDLFRYNVPLRFPQHLRREHTYILGNTGSGKTQLIQQLISYDLDSNASIIVIDSQGDLINTLKRSKLIDPERLVIIDPIDSVDYPLALNMFDIGDKSDLNPVELERHINGVVELLNFVFSAVMDSPLTDKQGVVFNFCIRLLLIIPEATLETLVHILEHGVDDYTDYVNSLPSVAKTFFFNSFHNRDYYQTRIQINRRLFSLLENPTISRLFKSPKNYLDISKEMDRGKVILISTDRSLLKRQGCAFFGRYFISLVAQAMQDRLNRPPEHRRKTHLYIDECGDYLQTEDVNITDILEKGRKYNVGVTLAHQQINQLPPDVFQAIKTNSAIKMVGTCSHSDSNALKYDMGVDLIDVHRLSFLTKLRGSQSFYVKVNAGLLERMEQRSDDDVEAIMVANREKYAISVTDPSKIGKSVEKTKKNDETKGIPNDPLSDYT